jgi:hypothetical protein
VDPRLDSAHFELRPRRQEYRRAREALLGSRGWVTIAAQRAADLLGEGDDWPSLLPLRPDDVLPCARFFLVDERTGDRYAIRPGVNTLGRLPDNDVVFDEAAVSRRHCVVLAHAWGGCELHDTASRNGTFLNGRRITRPERLRPGDAIRLADRELTFVGVGDSPERSDPAEHPETIFE